MISDNKQSYFLFLMVNPLFFQLTFCFLSLEAVPRSCDPQLSEHYIDLSNGRPSIFYFRVMRHISHSKDVVFR